MAKKRKGANQGRKQKTTTQDVPFEALQRALRWIINENIFSQMTLHGDITWAAGQLVVLAVLWVWSDKDTLTGAFQHAKHLALSMLGEVALTTYQGLTNALVHWTGSLLPLIRQRLHSLMEQIGGDYWRIGGWLPLAVDGSRTTTPRTQSNEASFSAAHYGQGRKARSRKKWKNKKRRSKPLSERVKPQIWLTLLWHMGLGMPWSWKTGPSASSERGHFLEMLTTLVFPEKTLFCGDAGFVGYELWKTIQDAGHHFLIRVGANVRQTFGRGKLLSRTPERALAELDWSLLGLWMIQLLAVKEQLVIGSPPERSSVALAVSGACKKSCVS
jgi:hypothetical protein